MVVIKFYNKEGLIEGYIQTPIKPVHTMVFVVEGKLALELNITDQATASRGCGVSRENVHKWLWEKGNELFLIESFSYQTRITITANDVMNGNIVTPFGNLQMEEI
ncbi:hypothetical protein [Lentibacillus cibarius]|uniref:Uncharacterized protein n=1 Tax=Lentibacillus cibarius TaxID=2583219 RepID=A0A5S3R7I0_9BACI|nr:hypothetical protein [Lentibacillus cibarius]TMN21843.1 hypothetical protein FFL34_06740 [Lentibacillus cibarius]